MLICSKRPIENRDAHAVMCSQEPVPASIANPRKEVQEIEALGHREVGGPSDKKHDGYEHLGEGTCCCIMAKTRLLATKKLSELPHARVEPAGRNQARVGAETPWRHSQQGWR